MSVLKYLLDAPIVRGGSVTPKVIETCTKLCIPITLSGRVMEGGLTTLRNPLDITAQEILRLLDALLTEPEKSGETVTIDPVLTLRRPDRPRRGSPNTGPKPLAFLLPEIPQRARGAGPSHKNRSVRGVSGPSQIGRRAIGSSLGLARPGASYATPAAAPFRTGSSEPHPQKSHVSGSYSWSDCPEPRQ